MKKNFFFAALFSISIATVTYAQDTLKPVFKYKYTRAMNTILEKGKPDMPIGMVVSAIE